MVFDALAVEKLKFLKQCNQRDMVTWGDPDLCLQPRMVWVLEALPALLSAVKPEEEPPRALSRQRGKREWCESRWSTHSEPGSKVGLPPHGQVVEGLCGVSSWGTGSCSLVLM